MSKMSSFQPICKAKRVACFTVRAFLAQGREVIDVGQGYLAWLRMAMSNRRSPKYFRMNIKGLAILPMT